MFLKSYVELGLDFDVVRAAMLRPPPGWQDGLADQAASDRDALLAECGLGPRHASGSIHISLDTGRPIVTDRMASLPWRLAEERPCAFPDLEGSLDAAWLGTGRTQLALVAQYHPRRGPASASADRALLHRVVETVTQRLLVAIAGRLACPVLPV
jgi:hypothetical protein